MCPAPIVLDYLIQYLEATPESSWLSVLEVRRFGLSDTGRKSLTNSQDIPTIVCIWK
jgi:hypothetical protein